MEIESFRPWRGGDTWASMWSRSGQVVPRVLVGPMIGRPGPELVSVQARAGDRSVELRLSHAEFMEFSEQVRAVAAKLSESASATLRG